MKKDCLIIGSYINSFEKEKYFLNNLKLLKDEFDICLSSHYPCDPVFINYVDYFVYDCKNEKINSDSGGTFWCYGPNFYFVNSVFVKIKNHGYAMMKQIWNCLPLLKRFGYTDFFYLEPDICFRSKENLDLFKSFKTIAESKNKSSVFFEASNCGSDSLSSIHFPFFYSTIDFFNKALGYIPLEEFSFSKNKRTIEYFFVHSAVDNGVYNDIALIKESFFDDFDFNLSATVFPVGCNEILKDGLKIFVTKDLNNPSDIYLVVHRQEFQNLKNGFGEIEVKLNSYPWFSFFDSLTTFCKQIPCSEEDKNIKLQFLKIGEINLPIKDIVNNDNCYIKF